MGQPRPVRSISAPVRLANRYGTSRCHARTASTANSGKVCSSASTASAMPCARKNCVASAPQAIMRLAIRMPGPAHSTAHGLPACNDVSPASTKAVKRNFMPSCEFPGGDQDPGGDRQWIHATPARTPAASPESPCDSARRGSLPATARTPRSKRQPDGYSGARSPPALASAGIHSVRSSVWIAASRPVRSRTIPQCSQVSSRTARSVVIGARISWAARLA